MEGTARQPTATGDIRTRMIIAAALIEGVTLFAIVVCLLLAIKASSEGRRGAPPPEPVR